MVSQDRQRIIETNRSLRNIKNELESLLEKGVVSDDAFDSIQRLLPAEQSLSGGSSAAAAAPTPAAVPTKALSALHLGNASAAAPPPSYTQSAAAAAAAAGPPALPTRKGPPAAEQTKPVLCHARGLYRYAATDARDCSFDKDDRLAVHDKMNADWWMGRNLRTGQEGIFPQSYVEVEEDRAAAPGPAYGDEKRAAAAGSYPPPPAQRAAYNPPMDVAEQSGGGGGGGGGGQVEKKSKGGEHKKNFTNAAVFGAGATFGSKIVSSIF